MQLLPLCFSHTNVSLSIQYTVHCFVLNSKIQCTVSNKQAGHLPTVLIIPILVFFPTVFLKNPYLKNNYTYIAIFKSNQILMVF